MSDIGAGSLWRLASVIRSKLDSGGKRLGATYVSTDHDGTKWVMLDGSDEIVPVTGTVTSSMVEGQKVEVEVRDGRLNILGNSTDPAAGSSGLSKVQTTVTKVEETVQSVRTELVEADRVQAREIAAERARIGEFETTALTAQSAIITDLQADAAKVHNLEAEQLSAATAFVGDLSASNVTAQNVIADHTKVGQLDAAQIAADHATIGTISADYLKAADMQAEQARVDDLLADKANVSDLSAATARIGALEADHVSVDDFEAEQANIDSLQAATADIATIRADSAKVHSLTAAQLSAATGYVGSLTAGNVSAQDIVADHATIGALDTTYAQINMANVNNAWINNGVIKDGAISSAMINDVSANKLTAGTINGSVINVTNLNADNITTGTINGQRIGEGSLSLSKLEDDVYTETEVDAKLATMQAEIDGAIETWTGTAVPTLNNAPASGWTTADERDKHVGDVYFVVNSQSQQNGYNYRFTKSGSTYSWQLIKDSDVTAALSRLTTAEGKITTFDSDISKLKTDTGTLTTKTESLETRMSDAEADILDKVDTTTFNEVSDTVDSHSQSITQMTTTLSNKADSSTVTAVTNRVSKTEQDISGINTTIGELQETVESKADGSTVSTISNKLNTVSDTVDGHTQTLTNVQTTLSNKADGSTVTALTTRVSDIEQDVSGFKSTVSETYTTKQEFADLEIGGRNLALNTSGVIVDRTEAPHGSRDEYFYFDLGRALPFGAGTPIVISFDLYMPIKSSSPRFLVYNSNCKGPHRTLSDIDVLSGKNLPVGSVVDERIVIETSVYADRPDSELPNDYLEFYSNYGSKNYYRIANLKLEKGNRATDWTPAPEDIEERVSSAESSITQNAQNIELKVSKDGVISSINQSAETVKIQASKVEIDGTAVFSAISSDVDDAITDKGYQTSSQVESAITSKGYATTTQAQGYATTAKSEAISAAATDATTKANAAKASAKAYTDSVEIGGRNLLLAEPSQYKQTSYDPYIIPSSTSAAELGAKTTLTIQFWDVELDSNSSGIGGYWGGGTSGRLFLVKPNADGYCSATFTISANTASHTEGANKFLALYNLYIGHSGMSLSIGSWKLEKGNKATDWTPAPEDIEANAVKRTQRIWYRTNASSAPATPGTASSNWVTKADDGNDAWTKMHIAITSTHKYIYTCEQYEMADGTLGHTDVLLDNTITVIDGGNIITGTVSANAVNASSGTFDTANIPDLSAAKITSGNIAADRIKANVISAINSLTAGQIDADRIDASQLSIGQSQVTDLTSDLADAKKHTQVIVSATNVNYAANTCNLTARLYVDGTLQTSTSLKWQWYRDGTTQGSQTTGATGSLAVTSSLGLAHRYGCKCTF